MNKKADLSGMAKKWGSPYVARSKVSEFSGGILNSRTMANLDSLGDGPKGRVRLGRKIAYPVDLLVHWLEGRVTFID